MRRLVGLLLFLGVALSGCTAPPPATTYSEPQLKYLLLDHYGEDRFFYCDPDYYPVSRGDELEKAIAVFPTIMNDTAEFNAITTRLGLAPPYSDAAKLAIYREHKKLRAIPLSPRTPESYTYTMALGTEVDGRRVSGTIRMDGTIHEESSEQAFLTCPICLAAGTLIDTPTGPVRVEDVLEGARVWTLDANGDRIAAPVLQTARTRVPSGHTVVRVRLSDGRVVVASSGHPTAEGLPLASLQAGDRLDGAFVERTEIVPYDGEFVYDILPGSPTGLYRADGVLLGSTLR